ncbi:membrane protein [Helicobacter pylori PZ5056]|uniref:Membrane protein n=1 Tax=Helicobacter pylori PZ5056 TaxID=1337393 RepID=T2SUH5_HELPX|nr:membrane protein [Helicobacter pylori PZ5056]
MLDLFNTDFFIVRLSLIVVCNELIKLEIEFIAILFITLGYILLL